MRSTRPMGASNLFHRRLALAALFAVILFPLAPPPAGAQRSGHPDRCSVCRRRIEGKYQFYPERGIAVCEQCAQTRPRCERCGIPHRPSQMKRFDGADFCATCLREMPKCDACGDPLHGKFFSIRHLEGKFCEDCTENKPRCDACGRPAGRGATRLHDGRTACAVCMADAVINESEMRAMMRDVRATIEDRAGYALRHPVELRMVTRDDRAFREAIALAHERDPGGAAGRENGVFIRKGDEWSILILQLLPRELFVETLAHEYGHAIQAELAPKLDEAARVEGFAQFVAAMALRQKGYEAALSQLRERGDVYGRGYRAIVRRARAIPAYGADGLTRLLDAGRR